MTAQIINFSKCKAAIDASNERVWADLIAEGERRKHPQPKGSGAPSNRLRQQPID